MLEKARVLFTFCLNNYKDVKDANAIETDKHFTLLSHNIPAEQLINGTNVPIEIFKEKFGKYLNKQTEDSTS